MPCVVARFESTAALSKAGELGDDLISVFMCLRRPRGSPMRISGEHTEHGNSPPGLEGSSLVSIFLGDLDIFMLAGGDRARPGVLPATHAHRPRRLVGGTGLVPSTAPMGRGMVFQDRNRGLSL